MMNPSRPRPKTYTTWHCACGFSIVAHHITGRDLALRIRDHQALVHGGPAPGQLKFWEVHS